MFATTIPRYSILEKLGGGGRRSWTPQTTFALLVGGPQLLFDGPHFPNCPQMSPDYHVCAGGQRFWMVKATEQASSAAQINVMLHWSEQLKRRVLQNNEE
jgi:hypothetical protein